MAGDQKVNAASLLLSSLQTKEKQAQEPLATPETYEHDFGDVDMQDLEFNRAKERQATRNKILREGDNFVVQSVERRSKKKNFMFPESLAEKFVQEAKALNVSQNELIVQILEQRYK